MQKKIDNLIKYGMRTWQNPAMTSPTQDGYVATSIDGCTTITPYLSFRDYSYTDAPIIDWAIYSQYGHRDNVQLIFPANKTVFVDKMYTPVNGGDFGWGAQYPHWDVYFYYKGVLQYTVYVGIQQVVNMPLTKCDNIQLIGGYQASPDYSGWSPFKFTGLEMG